MKKKIIKKKVAKKKAVKKVTKKSVSKKLKKKVPVPMPRVLKPIGEVTHYFSNIKVGIVKFKGPVLVGSTVRFSGATTNFSQTIASMQYNHESIKKALKGKEIGIKVSKKVRRGDRVFLG